MSEKSDLVHVVNRTALIENILNQVIEAFCEPRQEPFMFFWNVILDSSIMPMGSKVKVATAIAQELDVKIEQNAIHTVMALRNAFAHHKTGSHPVITASKTEEDGEVHYELQILSNSGRLSRKRREDALAEFDASYVLAKESLVAMLAAIKAKRGFKEARLN
jgi:hypothetical protein